MGNNAQYKLDPYAPIRINYKKGIPREWLEDLGKDLGITVHTRDELEKIRDKFKVSEDEMRFHAAMIASCGNDPRINPVSWPISFDVFYKDENGEVIFLGKGSPTYQGTTSMNKFEGFRKTRR